MRKTTLCLASALLCLPTSFAAAELTKSESFDVSNRTSLKVLEPAGAHVFLTVGQEVREDETPAIFALPNADAYVVVKVVGRDGDSWSGKVEIKALRQTVLRFSSGKKAAQGPLRFSGRLLNTSDRCDWPENVKFVISREGQQVFASQMVFPGKDVPIVLERGSYAVQLLDTSNKNLAGRQLAVGAEGWTFSTGCVKND